MDKINPKHYKGCLVELECFDFTKYMNFSIGNAFKYVWRAGKKGGAKKALEDLDKAVWYLDHCTKKDYDIPECVRYLFKFIPQPEQEDASESTTPTVNSGIEYLRWLILERIACCSMDPGLPTKQHIQCFITYLRKAYEKKLQ